MKFSQKNICHVGNDEDLGISCCMGQKSGTLLPCVTASEIPLYPSTCMSRHYAQTGTLESYSAAGRSERHFYGLGQQTAIPHGEKEIYKSQIPKVVVKEGRYGGCCCCSFILYLLWLEYDRTAYPLRLRASRLGGGAPTRCPPSPRYGGCCGVWLRLVRASSFGFSVGGGARSHDLRVIILWRASVFSRPGCVWKTPEH